MAEVIGFDIERWLVDHDTFLVDEAPPILNTWYEDFHEYDVRHLYFCVTQDNDETAAKNIEVRWTIDGNVYFVTVPAVDAQIYYIYRNYDPSGAGTGGLYYSTARYMAAYYTDKRGLDYLTEVRIVSALGTNQRLRAWGVLEEHAIT